MKKYITTPMYSIFLLLISFQLFSLPERCEGQIRVYFADGDSLDGKLIYETDTFLEINPEGKRTYQKIYKYELTGIKYPKQDSVQTIDPRLHGSSMTTLDISKRAYWFLEEIVDGGTELSVLCCCSKKIDEIWLPMEDEKIPLILFKSDINEFIRTHKIPVLSYKGRVNYLLSENTPIEIGVKYDSGDEEIWEVQPLSVKKMQFWGDWGIGINVFKPKYHRYVPVDGKIRDYHATSLLSGFLSAGLDLWRFRMSASGEAGCWGFLLNCNKVDTCYRTYWDENFKQGMIDLGVPIKSEKSKFEPTIGYTWLGRYACWKKKSKSDSTISVILLKEEISDQGISFGFNSRLRNLFLLKYRYSTVYEGKHTMQISPIFPGFATFPNIYYFTLSFRVTYSKDVLYTGVYVGSLLPISRPGSTQHLKDESRGACLFGTVGGLTTLGMLVLLIGMAHD